MKSILDRQYKPKEGLSFVICCHNSQKVIKKVLRHLAAQNCPGETPWEVLIVDNASTDDTVQVAKKAWPTNIKATLRVVSEPQLGLIYARLCGIREARFERISFIDDDNFVSPDWMATVTQVMDLYPEVGACGSLNTAVTNIELPWWFERFQRGYAVGPQDEITGDITHHRGVVCGAGLTIRKSAMVNLIQNDFKPFLVGRFGEMLTACEDYEICQALRLSGWRIWYEPKLQLKHYLPASRLRWRYLRRMIRGVGYSSPCLDPYQYVYDCRKSGVLPAPHRKGRWIQEVYQSMKLINQLFVGMVQKQRFPSVGSWDWFMMERNIGRLHALIKLNRQYDRIFETVLTAPWLNNKTNS